MKAVQLLLRNKETFLHDSRVLRAGEALQNCPDCQSFIIIAGKEREEFVYLGNMVSSVGLPAWYSFKRKEKSDRRSLCWKIKRAVRRIFFRLHIRNLITKKLQEVGPDVLVANDFDTLWFAVTFKKKHPRTLLIYDSHELWVETAYFRNFINRAKRPLVKWLEKAYLRRVNLLITVNEEIAAELKSRYKPNCQVAVIRNIPQTRPMEPPAFNIRTQFKIPPSQLILLYVGGIRPDRGIEIMLQAAPRLSCNYAMLFLGDGDPNIIAEIQAKQKCYYHKAVLPHQVNPLIRQCSIGVCPYLPTCKNNYYSLPNKFWEFLKAGLPVYASALPAMKRLIDAYKIGHTYEPGSADSFINNLALFNDLSHYAPNVAKINAENNYETEKAKYVNLVSSLAGTIGGHG
jgi:glycosyltransferase involved in cell wall biosynthesis